jgi:hypothetical protein
LKAGRSPSKIVKENSKPQRLQRQRDDFIPQSRGHDAQLSLRRVLASELPRDRGQAAAARDAVTHAPADGPSPAAIQAALRTTTERLACELGQPAEVAPDWSNFEWLIARAVAAIHGTSPLLASVLRWQGPPGWREFLQDQKVQTAARHARIEKLLRDIDRGARNEGVAVIALKGAELHALGLYAPGERPMGDVDLLVRSAEAAGTARMLSELGFRESFSTWKHRVFVPTDAVSPTHSLGERADNFLKVEVHEHIREGLPVEKQDVTGRMFPQQMHPGLNRYPSRASLMIHLLLHAAGSMVFRGLRMLQLHDVALLSLQMTEADWDEFLQAGARAAAPWWALPPLLLTARYYSAAIPARVLVALNAECPRLLAILARRRTVSDVSLSYLSVTAFPGIEWSRSASEAARYIARRVLPSRETLELRAHLVKTQPGASATRWQALSQGRRMMLWLSARQVRAETMYPVRMALTGPASPWQDGPR